MVSKTQRKAGKQETKKKAQRETSEQTGGGSSFRLDERPIEAKIAKDDIAKETLRLDSQVAKCKAGVAWIDLLKIRNKMTFGVYNDRPENEAETNKLIGSFKNAGIVSMKETSAIPIIVDLKRMKKNLKLSGDFSEPDEVPELGLVDTNEIIVASGQHRLSALRKYAQSLEDELSVLEKKQTKISGLKHLTDEHIASYNDIREEIALTKGLLEGIGKWGVIVYDREKLLAKGDELAHHLSRNNTLHDYKETAEEVLITILKHVNDEFKRADKDQRKEVAIKKLSESRVGKDKNTRLQKVLHNDSLCLLLSTRMLQLGAHMRRRREFSVTWLYKSIATSMGLYVSWIDMRCDLLQRLGSKEEFPDYGTVQKLLDHAEAGDETAKKKVADLRESIAKYEPREDADLGLWAEVMDELDKHAKVAFNEKLEHLEEMSPDYIAPLSCYRQDVLESLQKAWFKHGAKPTDNEITAHLDRVMARVAIHLTPVDGAARAPEPLLCGFMLDYAWSFMTSVEHGIVEVCRWFEPLLDYWRILHPKNHRMDDWSQVMMVNLAKDPRIKRDRNDIRFVITDILWKHRRAFLLRLHNGVMRMSRTHSPLVKDKKTFDDEFAKLSDGEQVACKALVEMVTTRRGKSGPQRNADMSLESTSIAGMMALHVTSWEWLSPYLYDLDHYGGVMFSSRECPKMVSMGKKLGYIWLAWERRRKDDSQADISGYNYSHAL